MRKPTVERKMGPTSPASHQIPPCSRVPNVKIPTSRSPAECRWNNFYLCKIKFIFFILTQNRHHPRKYIWQFICFDPFFSQHFRLKHRESSSPMKKLSCNECDKQYSSNASLKQHIRQKHKNRDAGRVPGYFPCPECGKIYSYTAGLWQHTKSIHGIKS